MDKHGTSLGIAVLTVSDTRVSANDHSGNYLAQSARSVGHEVRARSIVADDVYQLRAGVSAWIADTDIDVVLATGGTGFGERDVTAEALRPLMDRMIDGFGELFRALSYDEIGSSTVQSRAFAGLANNTLIVCLPGSTSACYLAWEKILAEQLNASHQPCNFVAALTGHDTE